MWREDVDRVREPLKDLAKAQGTEGLEEGRRAVVWRYLCSIANIPDTIAKSILRTVQISTFRKTPCDILRRKVQMDKISETGNGDGDNTGIRVS